MTGHMTLRALLAGVAVLLLAAPAAQAADTALTGSTLTFTAADGEANDVSVTLAGGVYTVADSVAHGPQRRRPGPRRRADRW